ncbi:hypothetical protein ANANG_G00102850 [Anguilla anguilla]|uniref:Uncharacterized protein n=1 Tax=Anguilla anguilla TaxID=7936 RepID=A0A9D3MGY2_ANGAN|nr:hypothetical protein ANANG_G00102850 [Anguilla anguilla]
MMCCCDLCRMPTPGESSKSTECPPFVDNLAYCGFMNTQAFRNTFVALSSVMHLYSYSSKDL